MKTIDEQLDEANASVAALNGQLEEANAKIAALTEENSVLSASTAELTDNLKATKDKLATLEVEHRASLTEIDRLKAEAKTVEQKAAEIYGAQATTPAAVTPKGDPSRPLIERFRAITDPGEQTAFIRSLSDKEKSELFSNI